MDEFQFFLNQNINNVTPNGNHDNNYKIGLGLIEFLEKYYNFEVNPILFSRYLYIKNLCLTEPVAFYVPGVLNSCEKALMYASFYDFERALASLQTGFSCEVIGTEAKTRTGSMKNVDVLKTYNNTYNQLLEYDSLGYSYSNFRVEPLTLEEQVFLYIKMLDILKNEENATLRKFRLNAYIQRAIYSKNSKNDSLLRAFYLLDSIVNNTTKEIENIKDNIICIDESIFKFPIVFKCELLIQLGLAYKNTFYYSDAYRTLQIFPMYFEKIDCLIVLNRAEDAVREITEYIERIGMPKSREESMILSELNIKLGHLYQNPEFFDKAASIFLSSRPYQIKGLMFYKMKDYEKAALSLEQALAINPQNEELRFTYGCILIDLGRIAESLKIFKALKEEDPKNEKVSKILSCCYMKMNDIENTLNELKSVAFNDIPSMNKLFITAVQNGKVKHIKWALSKMSNISVLKSGIAYLYETNILTLDEMKILVKSNTHVDKDTFNDIFSIFGHTIA